MLLVHSFWLTAFISTTCWTTRELQGSFCTLGSDETIIQSTTTSLAVIESMTEMCSNGCTNSCNFLVFSLCWWCKTSKCSLCLGTCCCPCGCCNEENFTRGLIPFDMSFLIVRLLGTNTKMAEELLDVLIDNHLDYLIKNECSRVARLQESSDDQDGLSLGKVISGIIPAYY